MNYGMRWVYFCTCQALAKKKKKKKGYANHCFVKHGHLKMYRVKIAFSFDMSSLLTTASCTVYMSLSM